jgi:hypothetical protein
MIRPKAIAVLQHITKEVVDVRLATVVCRAWLTFLKVSTRPSVPVCGCSSRNLWVCGQSCNAHCPLTCGRVAGGGRCGSPTSAVASSGSVTPSDGNCPRTRGRGVRFYHAPITRSCWHLYIHLAVSNGCVEFSSNPHLALSFSCTYHANRYRFLIVDKRASLHRHFCEIYHLPHIPELDDVNAVIAAETRTVKGKSPLDEDLIGPILERGIGNESLVVQHQVSVLMIAGRLCSVCSVLVKGREAFRVLTSVTACATLHSQAVRKLQSILVENRESVLKALIDSDTPDAKVVSQMMFKFLDCLRLADSETQLCVATSVGEIGGVDHGKLDPAHSSVRTLEFDVENELLDSATGAKIIGKLLYVWFSPESDVLRMQRCIV